MTAKAMLCPSLLQSVASRLQYPGRATFDEMIFPEGQLRPHWAEFLADLSTLPAGELKARHEKGWRLIRDSGVTYNVYGDKAGTDRPWELDPIPFLLAADEWRGIEDSLIQRATLLNLILRDLYGAQRLLKEGYLPPALVFSHPDFWRPLHGASVPCDTPLVLYAADLARSPDGRWWVIGDRTAAPSGAGYALENRIITARIHPDIYKHIQVERLAPFFLKVHETLLHLSPRQGEMPRIVLYTPGPYNETYFEHAYLARYLGMTLVEGEDLTTRGDRVYLKTLNGLRQVDVIIRRTDDGYCDPLELRSDSSLGIAGLVQAVHASTVSVANGLGASVLESAALLAFLPSLCRILLHEDLKMPSVATWWCGQERELDYVITNLDRLCVRPLLPSLAQPWCGRELSSAERADLVARLRAYPYNYVAQEIVSLSTAPVWHVDRIAPRPVVTRVHLAFYNGSYVVMPGGLTRVAPADGLSTVSMQHGGTSKDTWVLSEKPVEPITLLRPAGAPSKPVRGARDLSSRVADNMFWMGRHLERSELTTRILRSAIARQVEGAGLGQEEALAVVLSILTMRGYHPFARDQAEETTPPGEERHRHHSSPMLLQEILVRQVIRVNFDPEHPAGLCHTVSHLQRVATVVRDRLSLDTWRAIRRLTETVRCAGQGVVSPAEGDLDEILLRLNEVIQMTEALSGLVMENMTRDLSWRFLDAGRRLERAMHVLDLLAGTVEAGTAEDSPVLDVALGISDSMMTYRARYLAPPALVPLADLLLCDESNPRSLVFQLTALQEHMDAIGADRIPGTFPGTFTAEQKSIIAMLATVRTVDLESPLVSTGTAISSLCSDLRLRLQTLSEILNRQYFTHAVETFPPLLTSA
ncbi:Protein containing domains DUF404, DUF407, DUF403 [invertebrate metagenome]|uniref:Protein containing domains DUF404, DUF407, DUF403 n=1 Tax=invertebrate metagenome TaxID=1711999 RepID=A0A484H657_9ZZZZ